MLQSSYNRRNAQTIAILFFVVMILADLTVAFYIMREKISINLARLAAESAPKKYNFFPLVMMDYQFKNPDPIPTPPPPAQNEATTYVVQPGDTLFGIATDHDVPLELLAEVNGIEDVDLILVGQELKIPNPAATPAPEDNPYP